ncbi:Cilia- and flagella-associated protein 36 [Mactra antiquata]
MSGKKSEWVYDELLCFLGSAFFHVPVDGFIEAKCLIFDPSVEDSEEYKKVHHEYKQVIEALLAAFCKDSKLSHDEVIQALKNMNEKKDIREVFQGLFELVIAMDDYEVFVRMMTTKNIELQQQALMLIMKTTGHLPDSLTAGNNEPTTPPPAPRDSEDEIMRKVLEQSKREYEQEQKRLKRQETKDKEAMEKTIELSQAEVALLEIQKKNEQEKLNVVMKNLVIDNEMPPLVPIHAPAPAKPTVQKTEQPVVTTPGITVSMAEEKSKPGKTKSGAGARSSQPKIDQTAVGPGLLPMTKLPGISSSEAAANWLKSAQTESATGPGSSDAIQKAAAAMAGMSADEIKKRQEYLRAQRDKLIAMKKKEREKQLLSAEQSNPERPQSSRAARQMLDNGKTGQQQEATVSPEEQKKIEMRRQIANKLKAELMNEK